MRALDWILVAIGSLVVNITFPVADARRRSRSQVALTKTRTGIRPVGFERRP
jgi:hypothetical protein